MTEGPRNVVNHDYSVTGEHDTRQHFFKFLIFLGVGHPRYIATCANDRQARGQKAFSGPSDVSIDREQWDGTADRRPGKERQDCSKKARDMFFTGEWEVAKRFIEFGVR
jgi:hypothetical protein